ncbi:MULTISPECIES: hypothetical protein [unclassified Rhodanobacter]|uniref:hypothetical protein n=1 Tax=unclassified Rhodanobacter TaxID=2621553 RepID=UPI000A7AC2E6|nr:MULTISPECIES: hypothetical protein [unclassified Rhodanobacter]
MNNQEQGGKATQNEAKIIENIEGKHTQQGEERTVSNGGNEKAKNTKNTKRFWIELTNEEIELIKKRTGYPVRDSKKNQEFNAPAVKQFIQEQLRNSKEQARICIDDFADEAIKTIIEKLQERKREEPLKELFEEIGTQE